MSIGIPLLNISNCQSVLEYLSLYGTLTATLPNLISITMLLLSWKLHGSNLINLHDSTYHIECVYVMYYTPPYFYPASVQAPVKGRRSLESSVDLGRSQT